MNIRLSILAALLALATTPVAAQSAKLQWDYAPVVALADANAMTVTLKVGAAPVVPIVATCVLQSAPVFVRCTTPLAAVPPPGTTLTLTATRDGNAVSSDPYTTGAPGKPTNITIIITFTAP